MVAVQERRLQLKKKGLKNTMRYISPGAIFLTSLRNILDSQLVHMEFEGFLKLLRIVDLSLMQM